MSNWRQDFANEAERLAQHELVEDVLTEFAHNMRFERRGLAEYGLHKIVGYIAQIVLARARGIDPETLRGTADDYVEHVARLASAMGPERTIFVVAPDPTGEAAS